MAVSAAGGISGDSISFLSSASNKNKPKGPDFSALEEALQSGDLTAAKAALAEMQKMKQNAPKPPDDSETTAIDNDFNTLSKAIESGDLAAAKEALTQLKSDMEIFRKSHKPPQKPQDQSNLGNDNAVSTDSITLA